ncbi:hypothetical protein HK104_006550 [Borealophlyctis nickersoniae]|nr:hypothetical protein HK104_006550 [Borealophlyctis nickersoniae]
MGSIVLPLRSAWTQGGYFEGQWTLLIRDRMDRLTFDERIQTLDTRVGKLVPPKLYIALPLLVGVCGTFGSAFYYMGSNGGRCYGDECKGSPIILTFLSLTVLFTIISASFQYYRSWRTKQELVKVLNEFNEEDNEVGLNWKMKIEVVYEETRDSNGRRRTSRSETVCAELEYIEAATGPMVPPRTNEIPLTGGLYGGASSSSAAPPAYEAPAYQAPLLTKERPLIEL